MDWAEGCTALGKWRDEKAPWRGAAGWGATRGDERERIGGGSGRTVGEKARRRRRCKK